MSKVPRQGGARLARDGPMVVGPQKGIGVNTCASQNTKQPKISNDWPYFESDVTFERDRYQ